MIECGIPDFLASSWTGILAPPGTPQSIVEKLNAAVNVDLASIELRTKLKNLGAEALPGTSADFAAFIAAEVPKWTAMAKLSGANTD
jgi:tripartite-type tricarboxylate transporter receptor subunit TctC